MLNQPVFFLEELNGAKPKRSVVLPPMPVAAKHDLFAEAMLEKSSTRQKHHPLKWVVSLGAHAAVLFLLLLMPLYFSQGLDMHRLNMTLLVAPLPPAAAPPPPPPAAMARTVRTSPKTFTPGRLTAPSFVPKAVTIANDAAPPEEALIAAPAGVLGGVPGALTGGIPGGMMSGVAVPVAPAVVSEGPKKPVRVGGDVKPPRLISGPAPVYPILAKQSRIGGVVVIEAIIDEHGNVVEVRAISGHPLLIPPAMKAVSQRKYEPTVLDGQATPVNLRVEVTFHAD
jgi:outer membrane biosynthesis protein TonB